MKTEKKSKIVAVTSTALLLVAMFVAFENIGINKDLSGQLKREKLKSEKALSEKLKLEKDIANFKTQLASYQGKNQNLDKEIEKMKAKLAEKERALAKMSKDTPAMVYQKESSGIKKLNDELNMKIAELSSENERLSSELSKANLMIASLQNDNKGERFVDNVLSTENYRIDPMKKKNDKLTVRAKKMGKLEVSFDALSYGSDSNYRLVVKEQTGKELNGTFAVNVVETPVYYASSSNMLEKSKKRVELKFQPEHKLKEGIYSILVYHDNDEVGSAQIRLGK